MRKVKMMVVAVALAAVSFAVPAFAQPEKGDVELGANGNLLFTHMDPSTTIGQFSVQAGYYLTKNDLVGVSSNTMFLHNSELSGGTDGALGNTLTLEAITGHYRRVFNLKSQPALVPFAGVYAGSAILSMGGEAGSYNKFLGQGEAGVKFYVSKKTAFEVAYNLLYVNVNENGWDNSFKNDSASNISFGFTYDFGKLFKK